MPKQIDTDRMSELKVLDISNPPVKEIPHQAFPKMVYLHPKDKTKEHKFKVVQSQEELDAHAKQGWKTKPHIPEVPVVPETDEFAGYEVAPKK
jgi:hypothetical protein